jgi:aerobic carbon-monoxide dehydrogenase large subunit
MTDIKTFKGRREDPRFLTGQGRYTNDWNLPGQAHACFRRSDRAHAVIRNVDTSAAQAAPGVLLVLTARDIADAGFHTVQPIQPPPGRGGQKVLVPERPALATERVRFVGEEIALVVAETAAQARDAADLIDVDYEELPAVIGAQRATAPDAYVLHDNIPDNVCFDFEYGDEKKTAALIEKAPHVVRVTVESPRVAPTPMEVRGAIASYDAATDSFDFYTPNQGTLALRNELAHAAGIDPKRLRVRMLDVGGAFGARNMPFAEYPTLLFAARKLGRPVKWLSTRTEDFLTDNHGRAVSLAGELAFNSKGRFLALRTEWLCDSGAYLAEAGALTNSINGLAISSSVYQVEAMYGRHRQIMTNTAPTNAYRGAGRPEANLIVERLVDEAAAKLNIDPLELRQRNLIKKEQMPYRTHTGIVFDSGDFPALAAKAREAADWDGFNVRRREAKKRGKLRGLGCGMFIEPSGGGGVPKDQVAVLFEADGNIVLHNVAGPSGQSHETIFPAMVGQWLGLDPERITLKSGDPDGPELVGNASIGSRSAMSQGSAYKIAADVIIEKAKKLAAEALEANVDDLVFAAGVFTITGTDRRITMREIVDRHAQEKPHPLDTIAERNVSRAFPSGAHVAEVEIDPDTGTVDVLRYTAVDDAGTLINPKLAEGQLVGGIVQSAGQVFGEHCAYDPDDGQLITASFMDYCMPRAELMPSVTTINAGVPSPNNPLGAKGVGEAGSTGGLPACFNAVMDALRSAGVIHFDMPATPARIWAALQAAKPTG